MIEVVIRTPGGFQLDLGRLGLVVEGRGAARLRFSQGRPRLPQEVHVVSSQVPRTWEWHPSCTMSSRTHKENAMNLNAIIASLVLGSSSVAMAAPSVTVSATVHGGYGSTIVRDHRGYESPPIMRPPVVVQSPPIMRPGWKLPPVYRSVTVANDTAFAHDGRRFITVGAQAGTFGKLEISGAAGRTFIKQVYVQFDNGQEQAMRNIDRTLGNGERLTLDLDGDRRAIRRIVVYGQNLDNGFRHEANAFDVTAS
ncbi:MAG: hypothetical protein ABIY55_15845 [Kofleriaceae bacterium]